MLPIEPISLDDTMVVSPAPEFTMPSIEDEIAEKKAAEAENTNNNEEGENMGIESNGKNAYVCAGADRAEQQEDRRA